MSGGEILILCIVCGAVCALVGAKIGYWVGQNEKQDELKRAGENAKSDVNEDGCLGSKWKDSSPRGLGAWEVPSYNSRKASRDLAYQILEAQGEEGAFVAESVVTAYKRKEKGS